MKNRLCYPASAMRWRYVLLTLFLLLPSATSHSFLVLRLNLEQLTSLSERIFVGRCLEVKLVKDRNDRPVQFVTYEVIETLKGSAEERITFKQIRFDERREAGEISGTTALSDLPTYEAGEENIIFLSGESDIGLTAPVGLRQGKFVIQTGSKGEKRVVNGLGNKGLLFGLSKSPRVKSLSLTTKEKKMLSRPSEPVPYEEFVSLIKRLTD